MSRITINELSSDLKEYLNGLGLTEAQVQELIDKSEDAKIGDTSQLNTNSKDLVGAINELFQNANNGKELIANAIGNPLITGDSTFNAMSEAILGLKRDTGNETDAREVLYNMMVEDGYDSATSDMTVDELIDLLDRSSIAIGDIKQISCGQNHIFIMKNDGTLWACGRNNYGQLGLNDTTNKNTFTQVTTNISDVKQIVCGYDSTFILKNDGSIWSCGYNGSGQLGLGASDTNVHSTFIKVTANINNDVKQIACAYEHTFILKNDGSVWSCGRNDFGQLGLGNTTDRNVFTQVTTNVNNDVKQVACSVHNTIILKNDGSIWSCGYNNHGQLGLGNGTSQSTFTKVTTNINNDVKQVACGNNYTMVLKNDGSVWSCGLNDKGQLGLDDTTSRNTFTKVTANINNDVKQIDCGYKHAFILKTDGSIWSCGDNGYGELGLGTGDSDAHSTFTKVTTNINNDVKQIDCGRYHAIILKNDGSLWSCGRNDYGQLGLGDTTNKSTFTNTNFSTGLSEYDIDKLALCNYLLSNDISVTESMDIGTMLDLLTVGYINNMILGYENNLRIILTDEDVDVTEEDGMDSLIAKVDEEFDRNRMNLVNILNTKGIDCTINESFDDLLNKINLFDNYIRIKILFNYGDHMHAITGGWILANTEGAGDYIYTNENNSYWLSGGTGSYQYRIAIQTNFMIDLTDFKKLTVDISGYHTDYSANDPDFITATLFISKTPYINSTNPNAARFVLYTVKNRVEEGYLLSMDISDITGGYYVYIEAYLGKSAGTKGVHFGRVALER